MKQMNFETALRNSVRAASNSGRQANIAEEATGLLSAPPISWKRRAFRVVRAPFALMRQFLVGPLHVKVDQLHADVDRLHAKIDPLDLKFDRLPPDVERLHAKVDPLDVRCERIQKHLEHATLQNDALLAKVDALTRSVAMLHALADSKLSQIEVKIRGPLDYDETSYALRVADGYVLVPKTDRHLYALLADAPAEGLEPGTHRCIKALLDPGMIAVDVGANVGLLALACARAVGANGSVHAFEAEPSLQKLLQETITLNGVPWVKLYAQAAGASAGKAEFHVSPMAGHSSLYALPDEEAASAQTISVDVVPLDVALADLSNVDLVKIDVEGAELDVLAGMEKLVARSPHLAIIAEYGPSHLARVGLTPDAWFGAFRRLGFAAYSIDEATGFCRCLDVGEAPDVVSVNIAFVRPGSRPEGRLLGSTAAGQRTV